VIVAVVQIEKGRAVAEAIVENGGNAIFAVGADGVR